MRMELNVETMDQGGLLPPRAQLEAAFAARDPAYDGLFFVAVRTTGIFCRPSCPSQPHPAHVEFLASARECMQAGYRPCLRCHPLEAGGREPGWVTHLRERVDREPDRPVRAVELQTLGVSPERARRWFQERYGMTFTAWCRQRRLARVLGGLRSGESVDEAVFAAGYESHSGFREAFEAAFGVPPGAGARLPDAVRVECWETPIGAVMAGATDQGLCLLAYLDRERSRLTPAGLGKDLGRPVVAGRILTSPGHGRKWTSTSPGTVESSVCRWIRWGRRSSGGSGRNCGTFPSPRPSRTKGWPGTSGSPPPAGRWPRPTVATASPSSSPATAWWGRTGP